MTFDLYLAALALRRLRTSELPAVALQAIEEGHESAALAALAGATPSERSLWELEEMWARALGELGLTLPSRVDAGHRLKRYFASLVSSGDLRPREGAFEIIQLAGDLSEELPSREYAGDGFGIVKLFGIYYSHDDCSVADQRLHDEIDAELKAECARLAGEGTA
jgi:hypothetical protein